MKKCPTTKRVPKEKFPLFCVSDLHAGDGGPRDNFYFSGNRAAFFRFLEYVRDVKGRLIILGDLFEFWQSNISKVLHEQHTLLDVLNKMRAVYVLGNHDSDLDYFVDSKLTISHPFFKRMFTWYSDEIGGLKFKFLHGHSEDQYCASNIPGKGRISAIWSGLCEDKNGSPFVGKYRTVEDATVGRIERFMGFFGKLLGKGDRVVQLHNKLIEKYSNSPEGECYDMVVFGHTHRPGSFFDCGTEFYNCGTWAEDVNTYVRIEEDGEPRVCEWTKNGEAPCNIGLPI